MEDEEVRGTITPVAVAALLALVAAGPVAADHVENHQAQLTDDYIAGSVHAHAAGHHAVGPTDCSGLTAATVDSTAGGACFDLSEFKQGADLFLSAVDDHSPTEVSLFAGFDLDGDGCVGCSPQDAAWTGVGSLGADVVDPGEPLVVFVRAASLHGQDLHLATTGTLTLDVLDDGTSGCDPVEGEIPPECGEPFKSELPYPYACVPDCTG